MSEQEPPSDQPEWHQSVWDELHRLAELALRREAAGHSLQPTMLVNDAYMYLQKQRNVDMGERSQVMAVAARFLQRILVDHARRRKAEKRGGKDMQQNSLHISQIDVAKQVEPQLVDILELDEALENLSEQLPRAAEVVVLKFFSQMTNDEIADQLGVSERTVNSDWKFAKSWLYTRLSIER